MSSIKYMLRKSGFHPETVLKSTLLDYFQHRKLPNIKLLALNDTIFLLQYLGCDLDRGDIIVYVKLSLRLKMLLKSTPQFIPIKPGQQFTEWYDLFLAHLKFQVKEIFNKLLDANETPNENELKVRNHILNDNIVTKKYLCDIEREIIQLTSDPQSASATDKNSSTSNDKNQEDVVVALDKEEEKQQQQQQSRAKNNNQNDTVSKSTIGHLIGSVVTTELNKTNNNQIAQTSVIQNPKESTQPLETTNATQSTINPPEVIDDADDDLIIIENETDASATSDDASNSVLKKITHQNIVQKAKNMEYSIGRNPVLDSYFRRYCESNGADTNLPSKENLIKAIKELNSGRLSTFFNKSLEIYTEVGVEICRYYLSNLPSFLQIDFIRIMNDQELYTERLREFKSILRFVLSSALQTKLPNKLQEMQKRTPIDLPLTPEEFQKISLSVTVPNEKFYKNLWFLSQFNFMEFKNVLTTPHTGLTARQIYNFPGITVKCQFANIRFGRINDFDYKSYIVTKSRKNMNQFLINRRIIGERLLKKTPDNEQEYALSTKCLVTYFRDVIMRLQENKICGVKHIRDICSEFLKDIDYLSPSRKSAVINHEVHCFLSNYKYSVTSYVNVNQLCMTHYINPEVKIFLEEAENTDECSLSLICNKCEIIYDVFDNDNIVKLFSKHLIDQHGYFVNNHECVKCEKQYSFQELLNKRWAHECN